MSLEIIKNRLHQEINQLFAAAVLDELTGDTEAYRAKLTTITQIAEFLGIDTEITEVSINLKAHKSRR